MVQCYGRTHGPGQVELPETPGQFDHTVPTTSRSKAMQIQTGGLRLESKVSQGQVPTSQHGIQILRPLVRLAILSVQRTAGSAKRLEALVARRDKYIGMR